ncbi:Rne/Rng family ribonuclease [Candidatus Bealeia paramacronuclearis]|uniref:Ribonuclease G n=1 Tax=Candidatus Bealeia paramacronuclearis TaxID=1921001 RepID=A0ABZ2C0Q2_9PROT|nr:Rne/Rng family ribonuclease [Candidatus Bealeia paramacronuclearis]
MSRKMLIDAAHKEEIRVAILEGDRLDEYDFETTTKKQLKGNIYLAKVIRIEPSLQAAFVEFGGNRHGFLPFSEIHPDYYRIPIEDRDALLEAALAPENTIEIDVEDEKEEPEISQPQPGQVEVLGGEDIEEVETQPKRAKPLRQYKIQEVIKRRQIMLVQVVKEERGGKGAALTSYLSLAGRYCVLMPNALRGGGISRKITNVKDRKRLKSIIEELNLAPNMALIVRTAGIERTKPEIKRDCDYLVKLWQEIREKTLSSIAPCLVHEEGDIIKKALRDQYTRDIDEVIIEGDEGHKMAKSLMKALMPSHVKKIQHYEQNNVPLFTKFGIERQIDAIYNPIVTLKSGGYLVFGTTEALVAIDVNSGKATRERHIEETAYKTNLEAAEEVARQLRLRDLAGLVIIDFIDMDENRNNEAVERKLKDAMRFDRARVQVGRISPFGLLELSRQRLRPNILESTSTPCYHCRGTGMVRSVESSALHLLRSLEEEATSKRSQEVNVFVPTAIALYVLNQKRANLLELENRMGLRVMLSRDDSLIPPDFRIERLRTLQPITTAVPEVASILKDEKEDEEVLAPEVFQQPSHRNPQRRPHNRPPQPRRPENQRPLPPATPSPTVAQPVESSPVVTSETSETSPFEPMTEGQRDFQRPRKSRYGRRGRKGPRRDGAVAAQGEGAPASLESTSPQNTVSAPTQDFKIRAASSDVPKPVMPSAPTKSRENAPQSPAVSSEKPKTPKAAQQAASRKGWWQRLIEGGE